MTSLQRFLLGCHALFLGVVLIPSLAIGAPLPKRVLIADRSYDKYYGSHEYFYELIAENGNYQVYQTGQRVGDDSTFAKKFLQAVPTSTVVQLLDELDQPRHSVTPADLHVSYADFKKRHLFKYYKQYRMTWTREQIRFTRKELAKPENIDYAILRYVLRHRYTRLHSSGGRTFTVSLLYPDHQTTLTASSNKYGIPWKDEHGALYYNVGISQSLLALLPAVPSANWTAFQPEDLVPELAEQIYQDRCAKVVGLMSWHTYRKSFKQLQKRYVIGAISEQERSYDWQWNGENRLYFQAKNATMKQGVYLGVALTITNGKLFPVDSLLHQAPRYIQQLQQVPFLMTFLAADTARRAIVSFNNIRSLSEKMKEYQLSGRDCLQGVSTAYLNQCVALRLTEENGRDSVWLITPQLDVILLYYFGQGAYKYSDAELGNNRYHTCKHFNLDGSLKPAD
ncbi:hypothetical protein MUN81_18725 [Hymenobacter sp. 5317J-9]|uniref:hypothetical protein n=1 Tax=Hymenobacter sp. 5317J-9 TaxID=2932250 RepID=UPI001FD675D7|nr:hypothetical protein [Hymenobacter sp. 5317J-9]UOQ97260.1 hypothetical protein MUN81_18725 [Hymenobacter sp. 5317J-9]